MPHRGGPMAKELCYFFTNLIGASEYGFTTPAEAFEHHRIPPFQVKIPTARDKCANGVGLAAISTMIKVNPPDWDSAVEWIITYVTVRNDRCYMVSHVFLRISSNPIATQRSHNLL